MKILNKKIKKWKLITLGVLLGIPLLFTILAYCTYQSSTFEQKGDFFVKGEGKDKEEYLVSQFEFKKKEWRAKECAGFGSEYYRSGILDAKTIIICDDPTKKSFFNVFWEMFMVAFWYIFTIVFGIIIVIVFLAGLLA